MEPNYDWPVWLPTCLVFASVTACATLLNRRRWLAALGSFSGILTASILALHFWWPQDSIAVPWVPVILTLESIGALLVGALGSLVGYRLGRARSDGLKRGAAAALVALAAIGSGAIAGNRLLVTSKIHQDRLIAARRVQALYEAASRAVADCRNVTYSAMCADDSDRVRSHYRGPAFSDQEWEGMTRNLLRENGYIYQIHVARPPAHGVVVYGFPTRYPNRAKEGICLDDSARMQCPLNLGPEGAGACIPCESER